MEKTIRLCMFDMGGVVAKHSDSSMEQRLLQDFGVSGHTSFTSLDSRLPSLLAQHSKSAIDEDEMWTQFTDMTGVAVPPYSTSLWGKYFKPELDEHVVAILQELKEKGCRVVCATNTEASHFEHHRAAGQYDIFDATYASLELREAKPDAAFFEKILAREKVEAEQVIFVDDLSENCEAAAKLGINAFLYADPVDLRWYLTSMDVL